MANGDQKDERHLGQGTRPQYTNTPAGLHDVNGWSPAPVSTPA
uniref:Uncharacterized protein n=1 Tax=Arundo donax TaxID=35708 RepID=A0A0A9AVN7_ARUDO